MEFKAKRHCLLRRSMVVTTTLSVYQSTRFSKNWLGRCSSSEITRSFRLFNCEFLWMYVKLLVP